MNVLVIGRGGREHVLAWKLKQSDQVSEVYVAPGNDGMKDVAKTIVIDEDDINGLISFVKKTDIALTIVGPEAPLMDGIVDRFQAEGLNIFGPTQKAAEIEGRKQYAKQLMSRYGIPTARYDVFDDVEPAQSYVRQVGVPIVIKADGLAAGKGVVIAKTIQEADQAIVDMLDGRFGEASQTIVIEEFLEGEEFSLMAFVNGMRVYPMELSQDHKRAFDQDEGPNTGGMGAYSPVPQLSENIKRESVEQVLKPTAEALVQEGRPFQGVLYAGLIKTNNGPKVIEFNARLGDPEAQVVLPRLENDLVEVIEHVMAEEPVNLLWSNKFAVGVVLASKGYPGAYEKGQPIQGLQVQSSDNLLFHAGTKFEDGQWKTNGGRLLLVAAQHEKLEEAKERVYADMKSFDSAHTFYRKDIAKRAHSITSF
ncbi:phosphoribosylamine--glycine ligase [Aquisalibacillus elongatus]|uniref:Phosphoribosylamine--glycine ligase n=1 Tax=Aquisalibacillus elongatus TaxID=485577 RepID=A0A3N5C1H2_9BACI|nr:phosphoribosylamine--glycine ligase [Aquisalibacillus elongatus]RPF50031.1 phosphoribosylamine--glycine ligase [Aquisalibacillus elongatus]